MQGGHKPLLKWGLLGSKTVKSKLFEEHKECSKSDSIFDLINCIQISAQFLTPLIIEEHKPPYFFVFMSFHFYVDFAGRRNKSLSFGADLRSTVSVSYTISE